MNKYRFILASKSPRRAMFISYLNIPFIVETAHLEEVSSKSDFSEIVMDLSKQKGQAVLANLDKSKRDYLIVSSDTIVVYQNQILGKPESIKEAREMLEKLSGTTHDVYTGVSINYYSFKEEKNKNKTFYDKSIVEFETIDEDIMLEYLKTNDSLDKAGSYGIQNGALTFIKKLDGSFSSVVGFPLNKFIKELKKILKQELDNEVITNNFI